MNQLFPVPESERRGALEAAEARASAMMDAIEAAGLVRAGRSEREVEDEIYALAARDFGVKKHWHKRIVRSGPNALTIAGDNPPVRVIGPDDIVYVDLGPVFDAWEADIGRSYVMGADARAQKLVADLPRQFEKVQAHYRTRPAMTGTELYAFACGAAAAAGWTFGGKIAGHIVSEFAHAHIPGDKNFNRIAPANNRPMSDPDGLGRARHWILEIHLVDPARNMGGLREAIVTTAAEVARGVSRLLIQEGYAPILEFTLPNGRRLDVAAIGPGGEILGVEIKVALADLRGDSKWPEYLDYCDLFYFAVSPEFPHEHVPSETGLMVADRYGGAIVKPAVAQSLHASRRKAVTVSFAGVAAARLSAILETIAQTATPNLVIPDAADPGASARKSE